MRLLRWQAALAVAASSFGSVAVAQDKSRPDIRFNRWQEDWSVLADPAVPRAPMDALKYIPLSADDPRTYLSFGANVRERFESNNAPLFGTGTSRNQNYLLSRSELHADLRLGPFQLFAQLESAFAPWKTPLTPVDQDSLGLEQAFIALVEPLGEGTLKVRIGRQQMAFDLQRFVSVRDGPNVRQSFDAAWIDYEIDPWRFIGFYSQPVQNRIPSYAFDDYSSGQQTFGGVRLERKLSEAMSIDAYYARFTQDSARSLFASGNEQRHIVDVHFAGALDGFDWDAEAMGQLGSIGSKDIRAWYLGAIGGYTFRQVAWLPRLGLQVDIASGNNDPRGTLGTFNPLFPNGYYFALAGYTGFPNIIHLKPSLTVRPTPASRLMLAVAPQWRQTVADAVYTQPNVPVLGTAGQPGSYTGTYLQLRLDWALTPNLSFAIEAVHFAVGDVIRRAGGRDGDYVGVQLAFGW
jgi:hypothetical protein